MNIIGISGSYGKTSCALGLHQLLMELGYSSSLLCSTDFLKNDKPILKWNNNIKNSKELEYYLFQLDDPDFLIIEIGEDNFLRGVYDNITFDYKVLTSFKDGYNQHRSKEQYLNIKTSFFNKPEGITIINKDIDNYDSFVVEDSIIFSYDDDGCLIHYNKENNTINIDGEILSLKNNLKESEIRNILTVISILYAMDMFDKDCWEDILSHSKIKRNGKEKIVKNRTIITNSGNGKALQELCDEDIKQPLRAVLSIVGGINDSTVEGLLEDKNFVFLNKYNSYDNITMNHVINFGANLYLIFYQLDSLPDKFVFNEVSDIIVKNALIPHGDKEVVFDNQILENFIRLTSMTGTDELTRSYGYCKNFWWRSLTALKGFGVIYNNDFNLLIEYLRSFKNEYLDNTLNYIEQMINYTVEQYRKIGDDVAYCNVEKIYLTMNNKNDNGAELELEMYKTFFKQEVETFVNRKDALIKIAQESKENDIILLAGRGNNTTYSGEYNSENFDDLDITAAELEVKKYDY